MQTHALAYTLASLEPVDNIPHQVAHLIVADMRDVGPKDAVAIGVHRRNVASVAGLGDRRLACLNGLEAGIAHARRRHGLGEHGRDAFGFVRRSAFLRQIELAELTFLFG